MKFVDEAKIEVMAGKGGNGVASVLTAETAAGADRFTRLQTATLIL